MFFPVLPEVPVLPLPLAAVGQRPMWGNLSFVRLLVLLCPPLAVAAAAASASMSDP